MLSPTPVEPPAPVDPPENHPLPPGSFGLPLIGETLDFLRSPGTFNEVRRKEHGNVFRTHILGAKTVILIGPEANLWIFAGENKYLKNHWAYSVRSLLGSRSLALIEGSEHLERRRLLAPHFSYAAMRGFVPTIESITRRHLEEWASRPADFTLWPAMRELAFEIALALIFGENKVDVPFMMRHFQRWTAGLFTAFPVDLPFTPFGRALASKKAMLDYLDGVVAEREKLAEQPADLLGSLLGSRDEEGRALPRETILHELHLLLFAGHDTTVTATSNLMLQLAQHPDTLRRGREAVAKLQPPLTLDALRAIPELVHFISEGMRLIAPVAGVFRVLTQDMVYQGYRLPKGWMVSLGFEQSHKDPSVWTAPERFEPERFAPERGEQRRAGAYIPFGGGTRICLGQHFAMVEMSVILAMLLKDYEWELIPGQDLEYVRLPFPKPRSGIQLRFRKLR